MLPPLPIGLVILVAVALPSYLLTGWFRDAAISRRIFDIPNRRSSHSVATPRGGGIAIVVSTMLGLLALGWIDCLPWPTVSSLCVGGGVVALIGFVDDLFGVGPLVRLVAHFAAVGWAMSELGGSYVFGVPGLSSATGWVGVVVTALYAVWVLNLTNFMDGIDGIASIEAITVCICFVAVSEVAAPGMRLWVAPLVVASATLGFLFWNLAPATVFMGDVGSGFLGFMLGMLSLQAGLSARRLFWSWLILMGVFVVDATTTLTSRLLRGERVYAAHRSHAYQHAAVLVGAHRPIAISVGIVNVCWLFPVSLVVALDWIQGWTGVLIAYLPLVVVALLLRAGRPISSHP